MAQKSVDGFSPLRPAQRQVMRYQHNQISSRPRISPAPRLSFDMTVVPRRHIPQTQTKSGLSSQATTKPPQHHKSQHTNTTWQHQVASRPEPKSSQNVACNAGWLQRKLTIFRQTFITTNPAQRMVLGMATMLFVVGLAVAIQGFRANKAVEAQTNTSAPTSPQTDPVDGGTEDQPSEVEPPSSAVAQYSVPVDHPRLLLIPKFNIKSRVKQLDVDKNNSLRVPTNIYDAGWYTKSAKPGDAGGATLIDGHVSGPTSKGVFYNLKKLEAGDRISIERGDRRVINYRVVSKEAFPKDKVDMAKALVSTDLAKPGLNLITCTGAFLPKENTYAERLLIYAVQE